MYSLTVISCMKAKSRWRTLRIEKGKYTIFELSISLRHANASHPILRRAWIKIVISYYSYLIFNYLNCHITTSIAERYHDKWSHYFLAIMMSISFPVVAIHQVSPILFVPVYFRLWLHVQLNPLKLIEYHQNSSH